MQSTITWSVESKVGTRLQFIPSTLAQPHLGDFTKGLVENPPTHIWTREVKVSGSLPTLAASPPNRRIVVVRWRLEHEQTVQAWNSYCDWNWHRCCVIE